MLRCVSLRYLQQIMGDEEETRKMVLEKREVKAMNIRAHWPEFSVKNVWPQIKEVGKIRSYLPSEEMEKGKLPDKEFFWGVVWTILPEWSKQYVEAVNK